MIVFVLFSDTFTEKRQSRERAYQSSYIANMTGSFTVRKKMSLRADKPTSGFPRHSGGAMAGDTPTYQNDDDVDSAAVQG